MLSTRSTVTRRYCSRSQWRVMMSLLASIAVLSIAACGGVGGDEEDSASTLRVAVIGDVTGPGQLIGAEGVAGFSDAFADVNTLGGINGSQVTVDKFDSQSEANAAQVAWRTAIGKKPQAIFFTGLSSNLATGFALQQKEKIPVLAASSTEEFFQQESFFSVYATLAGSAQLLVDAATQELGGSIEGKTLAVVATSTPAVVAQIPLIEKAIQAAGGKLVATEMTETGTASFTTQAQKIAARKPDAVVTLEAGDQVVVTKDMVTAGISVPIIGTVGGASDAQFQAINAPNYFALRDANPVSEGDKLYKTVAEHGSMGKASSVFYVYGYAVGKALAQALSDCGEGCAKSDLVKAIKGTGAIDVPNYLAPLDFSDSQSGVTAQVPFKWDAEKGKAVQAAEPIIVTARN